MAIDQSKVYIVYGRNGEALKMPPRPIVTDRDPTSADEGQLGHLWVNETQQTVWCMVSNNNGVNTWTTSPASGVGAFTSVTVTPGDIDITDGDLNITLGDLNVAAGNASIAGDLTVQGTTTLNGDIDFGSAFLIDFVSTLDAAPSILLHANGGTSESIELHSDQGTSVTSINIHSDVGGVTLASGLASADAINLAASAGGVDIDGALQVNIASSQNAADAIVISASAGGIDITAAGAPAEDIDIVNTAGSINITAGESAANSIVITSSIGGIDIIAAGAAAGEDIDIIATGSSVNINSTENVADSIVISSTNGGIDISALGAAAGEDIDITATGSSVNIIATEATADAIVLNASNAAGGIDLLTGGGEITISSAGNVSMAPVSATVASPTATAVTNGRVFKAVYTGFTTASSGTQAFTITNSALGAGDAVMLTVANRGSNDSQMTLRRVNTETAGTIIVNTFNSGAAALNGDCIITGWIID